MRLLIRCLALATIILAPFTSTGASMNFQDCSACDYLGCYRGDDCQDHECFEDVVLPEYCDECDGRMIHCAVPGGCQAGYMDLECVFGET